ncbi:hypothetical protein MMC25_003531 [Agyrium rufum]|nr:hypothetical protein [Agyrium rufum]
MPQSTELVSDVRSYRARWASIAIREQIASIQNDVKSLPNNLTRNKLESVAPDSLFEPERFQGRDSDDDPKLEVAIIGAGCAGLFTALIFDHLKERCGLDVKYDIFESNSDERLGGRLFTHYFDENKDRKDVNQPRKHDYYDVGAMRFPDIKIMERYSLAPTLKHLVLNAEHVDSTFKLFEDELGMQKNKGTDRKLGDLIPYYLKGTKTPLLYNDVQFVPTEAAGKPTGKTFDITDLPAGCLDKDPGQMVIDMIDEEFTSKFRENPEKGWENLMKKGDKYSVRQFFNKSGNRWYDQALSEMVLEDLDFRHESDWWCIEGGSQQAAYKMREKVEKNKKCISFNKTVVALALKDNEGHEGVDVTIKGEAEPRSYDAVFNSAPLGAMQRMDLTGLNLNWGTKQAIRSLGYGASCKVGILFKNLWWMEEGIDQGGVAKTDLPLRVCVYPSYNLDHKVDPVDQPGVLLCSYTWCQEAQRIASLINNESPKHEEELKTLLIDNLARLHAKNKDRADYERLHKIISNAYQTHHAYDWYADTSTTGAFAYFGPGQFRNMYPWIVRTDGRHIIIGEAASAHHAWVVGALESAVRGVYQFLYKKSLVSRKAHEALQRYNDRQIESPYGPLPFEYDRADDIERIHPDLPNHGAEGQWARQQVLWEGIRLEQGGDQLDGKKVTEDQLSRFVPLATPVAA